MKTGHYVMFSEVSGYYLGRNAFWESNIALARIYRKEDLPVSIHPHVSVRELEILDDSGVTESERATWKVKENDYLKRIEGLIRLNTTLNKDLQTCSETNLAF